MKKVISWLLVLALTATVSIGATLAYLADTDEDVNVMTLGKVKIEQLEYERIDDETKNDDAEVQEFHDNKPLIPAVTKDGFTYTPGDAYVDWEQIGKDGYTSDIWNPDLINNEVDKMVFIKNKGDYDAYVRSVFAFEAGKYTTLDEFRKMVHLNLNETDYTWQWQPTPVTIGESTYFVATATYNKVLAPGALTEISLSQIALDSTATNEDVASFGDTYQVLVKSQGIQSSGFTAPATALNEGFGAINASNVPWTTDQPPKGIDVYSALRFYQGDRAQPIHKQVTDVVFGLNKDYPQIVNNYEGTLVTEEQDVDVYSYYVQEDGKYTVYFLANGRIFTPKDSTELFDSMSALTRVDTYNMDVSRTEIMFAMMYGCSSLTEIDVSHWDVSNVTNMRALFSRCEKLPYLDVSKWDVRNVETTAKMFFHCLSLNELIGLGNWNTASLQECNSMFSVYSKIGGVMPFTELDVENWDMSNATNISYMFYGCGNLKKMDMSKWDVSNVTTMYHMFTDCRSLESVNMSGWNTPNLTNVDGMFNDCRSLVTVDVSDLDTANLVDASQFFEYCYNLKEVKGLENWDTSSVIDYKSMFYCCGKLEVLDLSSFNTSNAEETWRMFGNCPSLQTVYVGDGWDMSKVTYSDDMFIACGSLVGGAGTTVKDNPVDKTYAVVDGGVEAPGYLTHISDKPANG